ncbi:MAG: hypothetical protein R3232_12840, partial [Clostridia bacterium]|nr:hypothetical protein [Clostridia bacterium]
MKIIDAGSVGEGYFYNCGLDSAVLEEGCEQILRKKYTDEYPGQGMKLMLDDEGTVVGRLHYVPIGLSPLTGDNILVILCLYIHM